MNRQQQHRSRLAARAIARGLRDGLPQDRGIMLGSEFALACDLARIVAGSATSSGHGVACPRCGCACSYVEDRCPVCGTCLSCG